MACIDDLFDLNLEQIFKLLPLHYRLKCKEVCYRWYELLMTRAIFREDRHIYLNDCLIEKNRPPMLTFMKAQIPYDILTITNGYTPMYKDYEDTLEFWRHMGKNIAEIHISCSNEAEICEIFYEMPNIQTLVLYYHWNKVAFRLLKMKEGISDRKCLMKLKTIKLVISYESHATKYEVNELKELMKVVPHDIQMFVNNLIIDGTISEDEIFHLVKNHKIHGLSGFMDSHFSQTKVLENLIKVDVLPLKKIIINFDSDVDKLVDLTKKFVEKHKNVSVICLDCPIIPFPSMQITELELVSREFINLQSLKPLVHLNSLYVKVYDTLEQCVFGHDPLNLPKMINFGISSIKCIDCLIAVANSFPRLKWFSASIDDHDDDRVLALMFNNWRYLEKIYLTYASNLNVVEKAFERVEEPRLYLRTLKLYPNSSLWKCGSVFKKMSKIFSHVNTLTIDIYENSIDLVDLIKGIIPAFKELTNLYFHDKKPKKGKRKNKMKAVFKHLEQHGHSLRRIYTPESLDDDMIISLYNHLDQLCFVNYDDESHRLHIMK